MIKMRSPNKVILLYLSLSLSLSLVRSNSTVARDSKTSAVKWKKVRIGTMMQSEGLPWRVQGSPLKTTQKRTRTEYTKTQRQPVHKYHGIILSHSRESNCWSVGSNVTTELIGKAQTKLRQPKFFICPPHWQSSYILLTMRSWLWFPTLSFWTFF